MTLSSIESGHAIYGSDTLTKLYDEFTGKTIFNRSRKFCLAPSMGGSLFGAEQKEAPLYLSDFKTLIDMACNSEAKINRTMPIGSLYYFKCENQDYYKTRATRYFNLIKMHLREMDKNNKTHDCVSHDCVWCFFPMYWREEKHLIIGELSAYVLWFDFPAKPECKVIEMSAFQ